MLANDSDVDLDGLTAVIETDVTDGSLTLNLDGSFTYTPTQDFSGTDSFTYQASDGFAERPGHSDDHCHGHDGPRCAWRSFPLDEGSGLVAGDIGGAGNDGTLEGGALFEAVSGDGSASSVRFDGVQRLRQPGSSGRQRQRADPGDLVQRRRFPGHVNDPRLISKAAGTAANDHVFMLSTINAGGIKLRGRVRVGGTDRDVDRQQRQPRVGPVVPRGLDP